MQDVTGVRERIVSAALKLFATHGYSETSVEEIVSETGVTKGAFYYYFKSKEEVLELLHDQFLNYELDRARKVNESQGTPPEKLRVMISDLIHSILLYRANVVVFFQEIDRLPTDRRLEIERRRREYQNQVESILRAGIKEGYFNPALDPVIATLGIFGLCNYTYRWLNPAGRLPVEAVIDMLAQIILQGVTLSDAQADPGPEAS